MATYARGNPATWWKSRSCGGANRAPAAMFISPFRRVTSLGTLTLLVFLLGGAWYATSPARISRLSEALLSNVLGGKVTVKSGHLSLSGTLLLSGVQVETGAGPDGTSLPIFSADQIEARFDWISLLAGELRATQLTAIRPTLYLVEDRAAARWNYEMLQRKHPETNPAFSRESARRVPLPVIVMRDARVQWGEFQDGHLSQTASATVDGQFTPTLGSPFTYRFQVTQRPDESLSSWHTADAGASYSGFDVTGTWDIVNNRFTAATQEILLSDALKNTMPRQVRQWWTQHDLHGRLSQLWMSFDDQHGLVMGADLDRVSMTAQVTPSPTSGAYNVNLSNVRGSIVFGVARMNMTAHLRGELLGYNFLADADIAGAQPDSALNVRLRFPHAVLGDNYPPLFMAFPDSQDLLQRVEPHGKFDLTLGITRPAGSTAIHLDGKILCEDARMRFGPFPFPLDHVNGLVQFNENTVTFHKVTARADEHLIHIQGTTGTTPQNPLIDFKVWADDATFDDRLAAALPDQFKAIWDQFELSAEGSFSCEVKRVNEPGAEPSIRVEVALRDGSGYARLLPYRFSHLQGRFILTQDQTRIDGLRFTCGADGTGHVQFDGFIRHPGGDVSNLMPDLQVKANVPIDQKLLDALPEEYSDRLKGIALSGRAAFDGSLRSANGAATRPAEMRGIAALQVAGNLAMTDGTIKAADGAWDLEHVEIAGALADGHLTLKEAHATTYGSLQLSATGGVDLKAGSAKLTVAARGDDFALPPQPPRVLPPAARDAWNAYKPAGKLDIDATAQLQLAPGGSPSPFTVDGYSCTITPRGLAISNAAWPESVHDITGTLQLLPGKLTFHQLAAQTGPVSILCDGWYDTTGGACSLSGVATSNGLPGGWTSRLPPAVADFLHTHKTTGQMRVAIRKLERGSRTEPLAFDAVVGAKSLAIDQSLDLTAGEISLETKGNWSDKAFDFAGTLTGTDVGISGKIIDSLNAHVAMVSKDQTLKIENIDGKVAGGTLQGNITMQFDGGAGAGYQANAVLHDAQLHRLLLPPNATEDERKRVGDGRVSATLSLQQTFGEHPDRTGRGELVVQDGTIYNVPLAMGLMQLVTLRLPVARAFDHAAMSYYIRDNKVTFERILLESPSINLAGAGTLSLKDKALDLNFVTESPNELQLPLISTIINQIRLELLQLSVTGTIDDPRITPVPLSPIASSLQALLPHHKTASNR